MDMTGTVLSVTVQEKCTHVPTAGVYFTRNVRMRIQMTFPIFVQSVR